LQEWGKCGIVNIPIGRGEGSLLVFIGKEERRELSVPSAKMGKGKGRQPSILLRKREQSEPA